MGRPRTERLKKEQVSLTNNHLLLSTSNNLLNKAHEAEEEEEVKLSLIKSNFLSVKPEPSLVSFGGGGGNHKMNTSGRTHENAGKNSTKGNNKKKASTNEDPQNS